MPCVSSSGNEKLSIGVQWTTTPNRVNQLHAVVQVLGPFCIVSGCLYQLWISELDRVFCFGHPYPRHLCIRRCISTLQRVPDVGIGYVNTQYFLKAVSAPSGLSMLSLRCVPIRRQFRSLFGLSVLGVSVRLVPIAAMLVLAVTVAHDRVGGAVVERVLSWVKRH